MLWKYSMVQKKASDLFITAGCAAASIKVDGQDLAPSASSR